MVRRVDVPGVGVKGVAWFPLFVLSKVFFLGKVELRLDLPSSSLSWV